MFNIEGVNGTGTAAIRVGPHKLLRSQEAGLPHVAETAAAAACENTRDPHHSVILRDLSEGLLVVVVATVRGTGPPSAVPSLGMDWWCDTCAKAGGCAGAKPAKAIGGTFCMNVTLNATASALPPHYDPVQCGSGYSCYVFDVINDPGETNNLAASQPDLLKAMLASLAKYEAGNVPCCR